MGTKGKTWKWSEEAKARQSEQAKKRAVPADMAKIATTHGLSRTLEYNSWKKMMYRCYNEADPYYTYYGGRGIKVYRPWHDATVFCRDMIARWGERPVGQSLERINVNGSYDPGNCCWVPMEMQAKNRRKWKHTPEGLKAIGDAQRLKGRVKK